jgi:ribose/xylose/arabinose/galactoside ABC-type transport system permease subunit
MGFVGYLVAWISLGDGDVGSGWSVNPILAAFIGIALGVGIGWVNGSLVTRLKMDSFLVTLGSLIVLGGLTYVLNQARTLNGIDPALLFLGGEKSLGVPNSVILTACAFGLAVIISRFTSGGRRLYAVGSNAVAARAAGIDPGAVKRRMFMVAGGIAGVAGLLIIGELGSAPANVGQGVIFEVFAATVIGGVSLSGGRGSYFDVLGGVLLLSIIANALNLTTIDPFWVEPIRGFIILFAVFLDSQRETLRMWLLKHAKS